MKAVVLALLLASCLSPAPARAPTPAEAEDFLAEVVRLARRGDLAALCDLGGGSCRDFIEQPGGRDVPPGAPRIVGGRTTPAAAGRVAGHVLELCGTDGAGEPYYAEMLVFFDFEGELRGIEPPYWLGTRISDDGEATIRTGKGCRSDRKRPTERAEAQVVRPFLALRTRSGLFGSPRHVKTGRS